MRIVHVAGAFALGVLTACKATIGGPPSATRVDASSISTPSDDQTGEADGGLEPVDTSPDAAVAADAGEHARPDADLGPAPDASTPPAVRTATLPPVSVQPGGITYWEDPYFANSVYAGNGRWESISPAGDITPLSAFDNPQFDRHGYPQYLEADQRMRTALHGRDTSNERVELVRGRYVLTWKGSADLRLVGDAEFRPTESSVRAEGIEEDGRRVYTCEGRYAPNLYVEAIDASDPITEIRVWLPDPARPTTHSLENRVFHPTFLERMRDEPWGLARFMDWLHTNASPVRDWSDRRPPGHVFMTGTLNPRPPANGFRGDRETGVAYEMLVALCNEIGLDLWINVPHLATDDHVRKLAQLIRFGSDGYEPYTRPVEDPVHPPLRSDLRVFIEYSNEIWSWGDAFAQGHWAYDESQALGISKAAFNARRFCEVWGIFREVFGQPDRLVNVGAIFSGDDGYTGAFLNEMVSFCPSVAEGLEPDVISPTTYFGNDIQTYVLDQPWLDEVDESYWNSELHERHIDRAFDEWIRRLLSEDARSGSGPDTTNVGGGFPGWVTEMARTTFSSPKPIVSYEGGPSLYTNRIEGAHPSKGPAVTRFVMAMNRDERIAQVYLAHLHMAFAKGLVTHSPFQLVSRWSKWGQWGHLEYLGQDPAASPKYQAMRTWFHEALSMRLPTDKDPSGPIFTTPHELPPATRGASYSTRIGAAEGAEPRSATIIAESLPDGLAARVVSTDQVELSGQTDAKQLGYLYVRVMDADGNVAYRTFRVRPVGGTDTLVQSSFVGSDPALNLPWTSIYASASGVGWQGWTLGSGVTAHAGDDALVFSLAAPADEAESTLSRAISEQEYLSGTLQLGSTPVDLSEAEMRITLDRYAYHAPRRFAVFTSVGGFANGAEIYRSPENRSASAEEVRFLLPSGSAYQRVSGEFEIRIYPFQAQYRGHGAALSGFAISLSAGP